MPFPLTPAGGIQRYFLLILRSPHSLCPQVHPDSNSDPGFVFQAQVAGQNLHSQHFGILINEFGGIRRSFICLLLYSAELGVYSEQRLHHGVLFSPWLPVSNFKKKPCWVPKIFNFHFIFIFPFDGLKMTQWLRTPVALLQDPCSIPRIHIVAYSYLLLHTLEIYRPLLASMSTAHIWCIDKTPISPK